MAVSVATIVLGALMVFVPGSLLSIVLAVLGWVLLLTGIGSIAAFALNRQLEIGYGRLISGIIQVLFGLWVIRNPGGLVSLAATIVGILLLIHALTDLQYTFSAYRAGADKWWTAALSGGITLVLALLVLFRPISSAITVASFAGICLIVDGVCDLLMLRRMGDYL